MFSRHDYVSLFVIFVVGKIMEYIIRLHDEMFKVLNEIVIVYRHYTMCCSHICLEEW